MPCRETRNSLCIGCDLCLLFRVSLLGIRRSNLNSNSPAPQRSGFFRLGGLLVKLAIALPVQLLKKPSISATARPALPCNLPLADLAFLS